LHRFIDYVAVVAVVTNPIIIIIIIIIISPIPTYEYTGCPRRNGQNFGRVFLMLKYTDITQNTYVQS